MQSRCHEREWVFMNNLLKLADNKSVGIVRMRELTQGSSVGICYGQDWSGNTGGGNSQW